MKLVIKKFNYPEIIFKNLQNVDRYDAAAKLHSNISFCLQLNCKTSMPQIISES